MEDLKKVTTPLSYLIYGKDVPTTRRIKLIVLYNEKNVFTELVTITRLGQEEYYIKQDANNLEITLALACKHTDSCSYQDLRGDWYKLIPDGSYKTIATKSKEIKI